MSDSTDESEPKSTIARWQWVAEALAVAKKTADEVREEEERAMTRKPPLAELRELPDSSPE